MVDALKVTHPPDDVLWAYCDLLYRTFTFLRSNVGGGLRMDPRAVSDLGDALHNLPSMLLQYDLGLNDHSYRKLYLRPFDKRWGTTSFHLENRLDWGFAEYREVVRRGTVSDAQMYRKAHLSLVRNPDPASDESA